MNSSKYPLPWAAARPGLCRHLRDGDPNVALPDEKLASLGKLPLAELAQRTDVFAQVVEPVVDAIGPGTDVASLIVGLLESFAANPERHAIIQLYQLTFSDQGYPDGIWRELAQRLEASAAGASPAVRDLLVGWLEDAPDRGPIDTALFLLARHRAEPPPVEPLMVLVRSYDFLYGVATTIAERIAEPEDHLIALARQNTHAARTRLLQMLTRVDSAANRQWLLTEGYDNLADYETSAYAAAIHGRLIERLRSPVLPVEDVRHHVRHLRLMTEDVGKQPFFGRWWSINDYADGPEAVERLIGHVAHHDLASESSNDLAELVYFLESDDHADNDDEHAVWTAERSRHAATRCCRRR